MRGASALADLLAAWPASPGSPASASPSAWKSARVLVIWEPVVDTDVGPPSAAETARLGDRRVRQFWDAGHAVSSALLPTLRASLPPAELAVLDGPDGAPVVWDFVAVYPPGARWTTPPPAPDFHGYPVVRSIDGLRARLASPPR